VSGRRTYLPIGDYALISDCHAAALVSSDASIDWCCLPRFDSGSCFARLLDRRRGGFCSIQPDTGWDTTEREYLQDTLVLQTTFRRGGSEARVLDCFTTPPRKTRSVHRQLLRIIEGVSGEMAFAVRLAPRFDYGAVSPWIRHESPGAFSALGGDDAVLISFDGDLEPVDRHDVEGRCVVRAGERLRLSLTYYPPELLDDEPLERAAPDELDRALEQTIRWWRRFSRRVDFEGPEADAVRRSALVLKALTFQPTGSMVAAPTTSLPESLKGKRNWDYRYSWIRDCTLAARSLAEVGCDPEADGFRSFVQRSAAGNADDLQIVYGIAGGRRLPEQDIAELEGWRRVGPVRVGNEAACQRQLDAYGEILQLAWRWHRRGNSPDDDFWRFLVDLVEHASRAWRKPDSGIWEWRAQGKHFVHSKAYCWAALDKGLRLAQECMRKAPARRWQRTRREIRNAVETRGYDRRRGVFVQSFGSKKLDAALLLLPVVDFVDWDDERMVRTTDAIRDALDDDGLVRRHVTADGLAGREGAFLPCTFWLVECLARQGRVREAQEVYDRVVATGNDLGLFSEEYDTAAGEALGNYPQALTHHSHIVAARALADARRPGVSEL
jgi:GH15 family glucan-1,4-alpha-glucosidase